MRALANGAELWFDVSGPSVVIDVEGVRERATLVTVHGGPGLDHSGLKDTLAPLSEDLQVMYYDQRGHGRSDYSDPSHWNLHTWATDLRDLCDVLGLVHPMVLGSSFGGFVALRYAAMFPDHPGGVILTNTTGGRSDHARSVEIFRRIGGDQVAVTAERDFAELTEASSEEFDRVCYPLFSAKPGFAEEARRRMELSIHTTEVNLHYWREEAPRFDAWDLLSAVRCPVRTIAGEDDPMCPIELVEELVAGLTGSVSADLVRLPGARHAVFRDEPDAAFAAVRDFVEDHHSRPRIDTT